MTGLTDEQKAKLSVGKDNWTTYGDADIPSIRVSDGPGGLRIEAQTGLGFNTSYPAVCYPTASALACSFDRDLLKKQGEILAEECQAQGVSVLLGPGVNHKRSPLCGRNFEYYSEDPVLAGELAAAYISGLQENGIGASVKHFAGNSREMGRQLENSIIDEKALHEIYLKQFEIAVKKSHPWTIMNAYNRLNGTYCAEHKELMEDIARKQWGFDGVFVSDWGAVADPVRSFRNGLNLEMPGGDHGTSARILKALETGDLSKEKLAESSDCILKLIERSKLKNRHPFDMREHLDFAREASERSAVLLENDGVLPLQKDLKIALVGAMAKQPRYQGAGSGGVNSVSPDCLYDVLKEKGISFRYAQGYDLDKDKKDEYLLQIALRVIRESDAAVIVAGLPENREAEGYDRLSLDLPENQNLLIEAAVLTGKKVVVVLQCGAPVLLPWRHAINGLLLMYLSGCRGGTAAYRLLFGDVTPGGKLAETWPVSLEDTPCSRYYDDDILQVQYRESIFTGYRYYQKMNVSTAYPFGYGQSYTSFEYSNPKINAEDDAFIITCKVKNTGEYEGREIVQLYSDCKNSALTRPVRELKGFVSLSLKPQEEKTAEFHIRKDDLRVFDSVDHAWKSEKGTYRFDIGRSSEDIVTSLYADVDSEDIVHDRYSSDYLQIKDGSLYVTDEDFAALLGHPLPEPEKILPVTVNSSVADIGETKIGKQVHKVIRKVLKENSYNGVADSMVWESPLRLSLMMSRRFTWDTVDGIVDVLNGDIIRGLRLIRSSLKHK